MFVTAMRKVLVLSLALPATCVFRTQKDDLAADVDQPSSSLVKEFAYLAGGIGQHSVTLSDTQGWTAGTAVVHNVTTAYGQATDTMQVFKKDSKCAVVFSATDDIYDQLQQQGGLTINASFCGATDINGGYAAEMGEYMVLPAWQTAIMELADGSCSTGLYAVGHSMGGAMASLFAFCANGNSHTHSAAFGGGALPEVRLVTFGAAAPAKTALKNAKATHGCFKGTRQYTYVSPSAASKQFHIDNLNNFAGLATALGQNGSSLLYIASVLTGMTDAQYSAGAATGLLQQAAYGIGPMWGLVQAILSNATVPGYESLVPMYPTLAAPFVTFMSTMSHQASMMYKYDPVPQLFSVYNFLHPMVEAQPMPHSKVGNAAPTSIACTAAAASMPNEDYGQLFWGLLRANSAGGLSFPNHGMCCLISDADCESRFAGTGYGINCPTTGDLSIFR